MKLSYLDIQTTDPAFNLALEQYVFDCLPRDRAYFMLWQNENAIIVGKHQNTASEINEHFVKDRGIKVVRRLSGGGAVYHDLGNLNFTFIVDAGDALNLNFSQFCVPVVDALEEMGVKAEINGRNDITIDGKKFSGNSQYIREGRVMHHGTIMFDSNLQVVEQALNVDPAKVQAKGIRSVRSRVTNVRPYLPKDADIEQFRAALLRHIINLQTEEVQHYSLTQVDIEAIEQLRAIRYNTWEWNYGHSPACTLIKKQRFEGCGTIEAHILLERGRICQIHFYGDFFSVTEPERLAEKLINCKPERAEYEQALTNVAISQYFTGLSKESFLQLLCS